MKPHLKSIIIIFVAILSFNMSVQQVFADVAKGNHAFKAKQFEIAYDEFLVSAREGNSEARFMLAGLYAHGEGVAQDYAKALYWYERVTACQHR